MKVIDFHYGRLTFLLKLFTSKVFEYEIDQQPNIAYKKF